MSDGQGLEFRRYCGICIDAGKGYFGFKYCPDCDSYCCTNCHDGDSEIDGRLTMNWNEMAQNQISDRGQS